MNIVVLDGYTLNPGDLSWDGFEEQGNLTVYPRTMPAEVVERSIDADVLIVNKVELTGRIINDLPRLRYVGLLSTGYDVVDIAAAKLRGVVVSNVPNYSTDSVAQQVFAHILNIYNRVGDYARQTREGSRASNGDFCYWDTNLAELTGKTMGIVGFGNIGKTVAQIAQAFGMKVMVASSKSNKDLPMKIQRVSIDELFRNADIVSLHCPLNAETHQLVNAERLSAMKSSAVLINTARGGLVCEEDLAQALNLGVIAGYGGDVLTVEPADRSNPLITAKNAYLTPHIAWATREARMRLLHTAVKNLRAFVLGKSTNRVK